MVMRSPCCGRRPRPPVMDCCSQGQAVACPPRTLLCAPGCSGFVHRTLGKFCLYLTIRVRSGTGQVEIATRVSGPKDNLAICPC